jgi:cytochrome c5
MWLSAGLVGVAAENDADGGKKQFEQSCQLCHSLRLIESQRLSTAAWQKEVDKMIGWGTVVKDKQTLVKYLSEHYSNTLPPPAPVMSSSKTK